MEPYVIQTTDLRYAYPGREDNPAVNNINLNIRKGEFLCIIGHNGSGKSTLGKCLNGLFLPTSGSVRVDGMDTSNEQTIFDIRQKVGMVFQNPDNQIVATVVEEDVAFGPENMGIPQDEIRRRVDSALKSVQMEQFALNAPHMLSGGQKQRIAIAGTLAMQCEVIIFDEPTAMLDPNGREEVIRTIQRLNKEDRVTVILITHFMEEAMLADRVCVMEKGSIVLEGTPREIFSQVERMKAIGLDVPQMTELAYRLRKQGLPLREDIMTVEEMKDALCQLKQSI
ncbi:MAG: energy-coupling factor transporter ATPase [Clostridia bacterium]|nr:energy-coupling factor transporter ATPase [Clostridia bacterium]